jgi:hypothetical protein
MKLEMYERMAIDDVAAKDVEMKEENVGCGGAKNHRHHRPLAFRLADGMDMKVWIRDCTGGLHIEFHPVWRWDGRAPRKPFVVSEDAWRELKPMLRRVDRALLTSQEFEVQLTSGTTLCTWRSAFDPMVTLTTIDARGGLPKKISLTYGAWQCLAHNCRTIDDRMNAFRCFACQSL